jgi:hypothetical protein
MTAAFATDGTTGRSEEPSDLATRISFSGDAGVL